MRPVLVRTGFDQQQDVLEEMVLPVDIRPENSSIEAKPCGNKYTGTAMKLAGEQGPSYSLNAAATASRSLTMAANRRRPFSALASLGSPHTPEGE